MKYLTLMARIKYHDQEVASMQKDEIGYDKVIDTLAASEKSAHYMIMYLKKCEKDGLSFAEAEEYLKNYMHEIESKGEVEEEPLPFE